MIVGAPIESDGVKVFKVSADGVGRFAVASDVVVWIRQHWFRRALMCTTADDCPGCAWNGARTVGFLPVVSSYGQRGLLEVSPQAWDRYVGLLEMEGHKPSSLVGQTLSASRRGKRCPLVLEPTHETVERISAVSAERVCRGVACLFRLPRFVHQETVQAYFERIRPVLEARLVEAVDAEKLLARAGRSAG